MFSENLKGQLKLLGWTHAELAKRSGFSTRTIGEIISMKRVPHKSTVRSISAHVGLCQHGEFILGCEFCNKKKKVGDKNEADFCG